MEDQVTPQQEIRFAVVLYGGVSLAIYINGVAQELLRMVRSTAIDSSQLKSTEQIYREASALFDQNRKRGAGSSDDRPKARFVVDIISGTSAGGINGVALAKCIALQCTDMDALRDTWLNDAQIDDLLNDKSSTGAKTSLLDSAYMYEIILKTLAKIGGASKPDPDRAFADQLDLFVTATDLNGLREPLQLADGSKVDERVHRSVFQFSYVSQAYADLVGRNQMNDFTAKNDAMLAFAARCTSSFPLAFEPMKFDAIKAQLGGTEIDLNKAKNNYAQFFPRYYNQGEGFTGAQTIPLGDRPFADGGYLDNRPFSYAIDLIQYRSSAVPVQRKLLFIDPFPEYAADHRPNTNIDFVENAQLALTTLPRFETIRGDIDRVNASNRQQNRLAALRDDLDDAIADDGEPELPEQELRQLSVLELIARHGYRVCYRPYHILRLQVLGTNLAEGLAEGLGFQPGGDEAYFIALLLRAWRTSNYRDDASLISSAAVERENALLLDFDIEYERRRINDLISLVDRNAAGATCGREKETLENLEPLSLIPLRHRLRAILDTLTVKHRRGLDAGRWQVDTLLTDLAGAFHRIMSERDRHKRYRCARHAYLKEQKKQIDSVLDAIKSVYAPALQTARADMRDLLRAPEFAYFLERYLRFQWRDAVSLPLFNGTDSHEHTQIEVYRVSPADCALFPQSAGRPDKKLAGTAVAAFGGFLQKSWRENDIMWGRLDGAERILFALLPNAGDKALRQNLIDKAQDKILTEALTADNCKTVFDWLVQRLARDTSGELTTAQVRTMAAKFFPDAAARLPPAPLAEFMASYYDVPPPPSQEAVLGWTHRALTIVSMMIDSLDSKGSALQATLAKRVSTPLRWGGVLVAQMLAFGVPEQTGFWILRRWLPILVVAGVLLIGADFLLKLNPGVGYIGFLALLACFVAWVFQQTFRSLILRRKGGLALPAIILFGIVMVALPWAAGVYFVLTYLSTGKWPQP